MPRLLPTPDQVTVDELTALRAAYEQAGQELARAELMAAARTVRAVWGADAALLLAEKDVNDDGHTDVTLLLVLDQAGRPLWFNRLSGRDCVNYPGVDPRSEDVHHEVNSAVETHLGAAYDAAGGISYTWDAVSVDHFGFEVNTLILDIPATLALTRDSRAHAWMARPAG